MEAMNNNNNRDNLNQNNFNENQMNMNGQMNNNYLNNNMNINSNRQIPDNSMNSNIMGSIRQNFPKNNRNNMINPIFNPNGNGMNNFGNLNNTISNFGGMNQMPYLNPSNNNYNNLRMPIMNQMMNPNGLNYVNNGFLPNYSMYGNFNNRMYPPYLMNNYPYNGMMPMPMMFNNLNNLNIMQFNGMGTQNLNQNNINNINVRNNGDSNNNNNTHENKLRKQLIKELDEFQYKNRDKFNNALKEDECPICLSKYKYTDKIKELPCRHIFHKKCLKSWLSRSDDCPMCKFDIKIEIEKRKDELEKHLNEEENNSD